MTAAGTILLAQTSVYLHTTLRGELRIWERELDQAGLKGNEQLLDLGCGRGAVLIEAARRLPAGRAVGADLWSRDQSTGRRKATAGGFCRSRRTPHWPRPSPLAPSRSGPARHS